MFRGPNLLTENIVFSHLLRVLCLCLVVGGKLLNNSRLLYSSGYCLAKTGNAKEKHYVPGAANIVLYMTKSAH